LRSREVAPVVRKRQCQRRHKDVRPTRPRL